MKSNHLRRVSVRLACEAGAERARRDIGKRRCKRDAWAICDGQQAGPDGGVLVFAFCRQHAVAFHRDGGFVTGGTSVLPRRALRARVVGGVK